MNLKIHLQAKTILGLLLLASGIIFYIGWSIYYDAWTDIGVYSLSVILIISGIFAILLTILPKTTE